MSTSLFAITNSKLTGKETETDFDRILAELKSLNLKHPVSFVKGKWVEDDEWEYGRDDYDDFYSIHFNGPCCYFMDLYLNAGKIDSIYHYSDLYNFYDGKVSYYIDNFRKELFNIVKIMGGSEIIYLADNCCDKLHDYLSMLEDYNISYEEIKEKMIQELGNPIVDYKQLDIHHLNYGHITEFVLDDFSDLINIIKKKIN
jgi:hypothetical protein